MYYSLRNALDLAEAGITKIDNQFIIGEGGKEVEGQDPLRTRSEPPRTATPRVYHKAQHTPRNNAWYPCVMLLEINHDGVVVRRGDHAGDQIGKPQ